MPKAPTLTADEVIKILMRNGFLLDHQSGSHRVYFNLETKRRVVVPYHKKDLPRGTLLSILKEAGLIDHSK
ncbi:MAG: type II toxin-antitoxin system HicA family toxin [Syntrophorhabdales bacterium]|jgi:predicted RNA binding protein YcfA (HicA-like mRNA interferase family)